ncbi:MAG: hypothetical protein ABI778_00310 [Ignavibacteriota bacterium]
MKTKRFTFRAALIAGFFSLTIYSCTHTSPTVISEHGSMQSNSMNDNCMDCHKTAFSSGAFSVAGTVFKEDLKTKYPNGTVLLFASKIGQKDSLLATVEVDGVGNFYTTHPIDLANGVYPAVQYGDVVKRMESVTTNGACNSCHDGKTTDKIHVP